MKLNKFKNTLGASIILICGSMFVSSCGITKEQLAEMGELRREEQSLKENISNTNSEITKLNKELTARGKELKKCNEEKAFVEGKLKSWPAVWPDYDPNATTENDKESK